MALKFNKGFSISKVVSKLVYTILALYVGGTIMNVFGEVMNCTYSPMFEGLSLIGWTITDSVIANTTKDTVTGGGYQYCTATGGVSMTAGQTYNNVVTDTSGSGVLAVIGIIGLAGVVLEFISFK